MQKLYQYLLKTYNTMEKTYIVQMTLQPNKNIKPLNQKPYILPLCHHGWLGQEQTKIERAGIMLLPISNFANSVTIVPKIKDPSIHEIS